MPDPRNRCQNSKRNSSCKNCRSTCSNKDLSSRCPFRVCEVRQVLKEKKNTFPNPSWLKCPTTSKQWALGSEIKWWVNSKHGMHHRLKSKRFWRVRRGQIESKQTNEKINIYTAAPRWSISAPFKSFCVGIINGSLPAKKKPGRTRNCGSLGPFASWFMTKTDHQKVVQNLLKMSAPSQRSTFLSSIWSITKQIFDAAWGSRERCQRKWGRSIDLKQKTKTIVHSTLPVIYKNLRVRGYHRDLIQWYSAQITA